MTFNDAKTALKALAGGRYHSVKFELTEYVSGEIRTECGVYIDGLGHSNTFLTYDLALANMEAIIKQKDEPQAIDEMIPEIEAAS